MISAAYDLGVRYMESNASQPGFNNPSPNTGIYTGTGGAMLLVPRLANKSSTSRARRTRRWTTTTSCTMQSTVLYYCEPITTTPIPGHLCYNYNEILDRVTNQALGFLLDFNVDATMFHMNNLNQYSGGTNTLMGDYVTALYSKYNTYYNTTCRS